MSEPSVPVPRPSEGATCGFRVLPCVRPAGHSGNHWYESSLLSAPEATTHFVEVSRELLPELREWSKPVQVRVVEESSPLRLEFRAAEEAVTSDAERLDWLQNNGLDGFRMVGDYLRFGTADLRRAVDASMADAARAQGEDRQ